MKHIWLSNVLEGMEDYAAQNGLVDAMFAIREARKRTVANVEKKRSVEVKNFDWSKQINMSAGDATNSNNEAAIDKTGISSISDLVLESCLEAANLKQLN